MQTYRGASNTHLSTFFQQGRLAILILLSSWTCFGSERSEPFFAATSPETSIECLPFEAFAASSINLSVFRSSGILTRNDSTWVSYFAANEQVVVGHQPRSDGAWRWTKLETEMEARMLGDGHQSINMGLSVDNILHLCWGAHATKPVYRALNASSLEIKKVVSPFPANELASYPQFINHGETLLLFSRLDHSSDITVRQYFSDSTGWGPATTLLLCPPAAESIYIHTPASRGNLLALAYTLRWPDSPEIRFPRVMNIDLRAVVLSDSHGKLSETSLCGTPSATADMSEPIYSMGLDRVLLNQGGSAIDRAGRLLLACTNADASGNWQISLVVWSPTENSSEEIVVRNTQHKAVLAGRGTLRLPISRAIVLIYEPSLYVLYRIGNQILLSVTSAELSPRPIQWKHHEIANGELGAWEPVGNIAQTMNGPVLKFLLQYSVQAPEDHRAHGVPGSKIAIVSVDLHSLR